MELQTSQPNNHTPQPPEPVENRDKFRPGTAAWVEGLFSASTVFMVLGSVAAIQEWRPLVAQGMIGAACGIPLLLITILSMRQAWLKWKSERKIFRAVSFSPYGVGVSLMVGMLGLGAANIYFSMDPMRSGKGLALFFASGLSPLICILWLGRSISHRVLVYVWTFCFLILCVWGWTEFFTLAGSEDRIVLLTNNSIPAGSLMILLSLGPLLFWQKTRKFPFPPLVSKICLGTLLAGCGLLVVIGQRGPWLALVVALVVFGLLRFRHLAGGLGIVVMMLGLGLFLAKNTLPEQYRYKLTNPDGITLRLELWSLGLTIAQENPVFGIGYMAPLESLYPPDYQLRFHSPDSPMSFEWTVKANNSFDNMLLGSIVEMGIPFTLVYLGFLGLVLTRYAQCSRTCDRIPVDAAWCLAIVAAFLVHSLTFDSLRFPNLNWLFHSLLGYMLAAPMPWSETGE